MNIKRHNGTPGFVVSIHRNWTGHGKTYRYLGAHLLWNKPVLGQRWGWHTDYLGRKYVYLGYLCLWQDIRPRKRNSRAFTSRKFHGIELVH